MKRLWFTVLRHWSSLQRWLRHNNARLWSSLVIMLVIATAITVGYLFRKVVLSSGFYDALSELCKEDDTCKSSVQTTAILLIIPLLGLPIVWFTTLCYSWLHHRHEGRAKVSEFFLTLTTLVVPFFVLGLGMLLELHKLAEALHTDAVDAVGAIAGIMILYTLTLLGGFVFAKLDRAQTDITASLSHASNWLQVQQRLSDSKGYNAPSPAAPILNMIGAWADLYSPNHAGPDKATISESIATPRDVCISTLLHTYAQEERKDMSGELNADRVPQQVWPQRVLGNIVKGKAAFLATNVGYYATFLENLVPRLREGAKGQNKPCMAVITYVLPTHWWNWPMEKDVDAIYDPILRYRLAQEEFARQDGRIFRRIILKDSDDPNLPQLWHKENPQVFAFRDNSWSFILHPDTHEPQRSEPHREVAWPGSVLPHTQLTGEQKGLIAPSLNHALNGSRSAGSVYWVVKSQDCICPNRPHVKKECLRGIRDAYKEAMHPVGGKTEVITITSELFLADMDDAPQGNNPGLSGCSDIMFLGLCEDSDVWYEHSRPEWGCALMATMGRNTETMFLTVIHDQSNIRRLWGAVQAALPATTGNFEIIDTVVP